jgi:peptide/nickel transport system permease protein
MYLVMILTYSFLFNGMIEVTMRDQIREQVKTERLRFANKPGIDDQDLVRHTEEREQQLYQQYGLDKPYLEKVVAKTWQIATFQYGKATHMRSGKQDQDVWSIIVEVLPNTAILFTSEIVIVVLLGVALGIRMARKPNGPLDRTVSLITMITNGLPSWWAGMLLIMLFAYTVPIFPSGGISSVPPLEGFAGIVDMLYHMILPLFTLVILAFWGVAYITRNIVLGTLQEDFIMAARARGIPELKVLYGHTMRTAMPAIITIAVTSLFSSISGNLVFEGIFNWPGMGNLYWTALQQGDVPVLMGNLALTTAINMVGFVLIDILYGFLDPRIKVGGKA